MDEVQTLAFIMRRRKRMRKASIQQNRRRLKGLRDGSNPFLLTEEAFQEMYHLSRQLARQLVEELKPHMPAASRSTSVSPELKILSALHFYGQGIYQNQSERDGHLGLSQSSISRFLEEVTEALNTPEILTKWIAFPLTPEEQSEAIKRNYRACKIPGVIGLIDGIQVSIRTPSTDDHLYVNSEGRHSINCQIICDTDLMILNCVARFPGSTIDSYVWSQCEVHNEMRRLWQSGESRWLLGDSDYPHQPWLQTPFTSAVDGSPEERYNEIHANARLSVERCVGALKNRFRCLSQQCPLEYGPEKAGRIFSACCVLHNMCVKEELDAMSRNEDPSQFNAEMERELMREAQLVRNNIVNHLATQPGRME